MVAVNADGKPTPVPRFRPSTADEVRRFLGAKLRRELRQELEARYSEIHAQPAPSSLGEILPGGPKPDLEAVASAER